MWPNIFHPSRRGQEAAPQDEESVIASAVIPPALRWATRRTRHQHRQRKADATCDQQRAERIILHLFRHDFRTLAQSLAAVLIGVLGVAGGGVAGVARGILGLAVQILHRAGGLADMARSLRLSVACHIADSAFDFTGNILCRAGNSILVHRAHSLLRALRNTRLEMIPDELTDKARSGSGNASIRLGQRRMQSFRESTRRRPPGFGRRYRPQAATPETARRPPCRPVFPAVSAVSVRSRLRAASDFPSSPWSSWYRRGRARCR